MEPLRVIAVSAPENESGHLSPERIYSRDPASMFNAMRVAAAESEKPESAWHNSNFAGSRKDRRDKLLLMYSLDDMPAFEAILRKERPHVLFLGAMTLSMPGAIACAKKAREILGDDVLIVLGGRHTSETIYHDDKVAGLVPLGKVAQEKTKPVIHHAGSPLKLMAEKKIPPVFDVVVSGQGEYAISKLGEIANKARAAGSVRNIIPYLDELKSAPGDWIAGYVKGDKIETISSAGKPIDYNALPSPSTLFGVRAEFDVFEGRPTAHVFSDIGMGCVYSCDFCSEAAAVTGKPIDLDRSPERLYGQLSDAQRVIHEDYGKPASAFVEDSIFLGGSPRLIDRFCELCREQPLKDITFGCQFTVDGILKNKDLLKKLKDTGLSYIFMGIETLSPDEIGGMSKDVGKGGDWMARTKEAITFLDSIGIKTGAAILFGLGESQESRLKLLDKVEELQAISPTALRPVSANWGVQHPLHGKDHGANYDYLRWGTSTHSPLFPYFQQFGEASEQYPLAGKAPPKAVEVKAICEKLDALNKNAPMVRIEAGDIQLPALTRNGELPFVEATQVGFHSTADYQAAAGDALEHPLYYGGLGTPTDKKLARHIAEMEGAIEGSRGILTPSGQAAVAQTLSTLVKPGDHLLVVDSAIYSTKKYFCDAVLRKMGVEVEYYDPRLGENITKHIKPNTKAIYMESPGAYTQEIQQVDAITAVARKHNITTVMDNTWSASTYFKPLQHGVDVSVVSLGKYHFGPAGIPMGAIVTANKDIYDQIKTHSTSWGNRVSARDSQAGWGALKTLEERLKQQEASGLAVAEFLAQRPEVQEVMHPALSSHPQHELWERDFSGANSLVPFRLRERLPRGYAKKLQDHLAEQGVVTVGDGWGGSFSVTTQFNPNEGRETIPPREGECIRLYIGHEDPKTIKTHLERALARTNKELGL